MGFTRKLAASCPWKKNSRTPNMFSRTIWISVTLVVSFRGVCGCLFSSDTYKLQPRPYGCLQGFFNNEKTHRRRLSCHFRGTGCSVGGSVASWILEFLYLACCCSLAEIFMSVTRWVELPSLKLTVEALETGWNTIQSIQLSAFIDT